MKWISFQRTAAQMRERTKTVTRRLGWATLQPGTLLHAAEDVKRFCLTHLCGNELFCKTCCPACQVKAGQPRKKKARPAR